MTASLAGAILPVYNGARRLRAALDSAVGQDHRRPVHERGICQRLISVRNGEPFIGEAIASVLAQSLQPADILVLNDSSTNVLEGAPDCRWSATATSQRPSGFGSSGLCGCAF
jgi:hypothetical protein